MKQGIYIVLVLLLVALLRCSIQVTGVETTNGMVSATIVHEDGTPAAHTPVFLMPLSYDPVKDTPLPGYLNDITDENGNADFIIEYEGSFNLLATHPALLTRSFTASVHVNNDTIEVIDTLKVAGAAKIELPDSADTVTGYLYIPGTNRYQKLAEEMLLHVGNKVHVVFDSIPAGNIPGIYFGKHDTLFNAIPLTDAFLVTSGDTVTITSQVEWFVYNTNNSGLPSNNVLAVLTDNTGRLWAGTNTNGLASFDGAAWVVYTDQNSPLPGNTIQALAYESGGTLWVGTTEGAASFTDSVWQVYTTANSGIINNYIAAIAIDSEGHKWFANVDGCMEFDGSSWKRHTGPSGDPMGTPTSIAVDRQGMILVGTEDGLFTYDKNEWKKILVHDNVFTYNNITDIAVDMNNHAWLATAAGLASCSNGECTIFNTGLDFFTNKFKSVAVDPQNTVWAGTFYEATVAKCSDPIVIYNRHNTGVLSGAVRISDIDASVQNAVYIATDYNGIALVKVTLGVY